MTYPSAIPDLSDGAVNVAGGHGKIRDALAAALAELGVNPSGTSATVAERLQALGITVLDEGLQVATEVKQIDFAGAGVTATTATGKVVVTIPGGGGTSEGGVEGPPGPAGPAGPAGIDGKGVEVFAFGEAVPSTVPARTLIARFPADQSAAGLASTDVFTLTAHGLTANQEILAVYAGPAPIAKGVNYFARDVTANTFKLAATSGGAAIDITADGNLVFNK